MKNTNQDIDKLTQELLKKSLVKPSSSDFDDQLMRRIEKAPAPKQLKSNDILKKAWMFLSITIVLFILSVLLMSGFGKNYFQNISVSSELILNYVLYGGLVLFVPLVLFHFDTLVQIMFMKRNNQEISFTA